MARDRLLLSQERVPQHTPTYPGRFACQSRICQTARVNQSKGMIHFLFLFMLFIMPFVGFVNLQVSFAIISTIYKYFYCFSAFASVLSLLSRTESFLLRFQLFKYYFNFYLPVFISHSCFYFCSYSINFS